MRLLRGLHNAGLAEGRSVATIGNFDGVHRGHQAILAQLREQASALKLPSVVIVFEPQPQEFFQPDTAPPRLMTLSEKLRALSQQDIDYLFCLKFDRALSQLSATDFVQKVLVEHLRVKHLVVGDDFRFGDGRSGDFALLGQLGQQFDFSVENTHTIGAQQHGVGRISSTAIRDCLAAADLTGAQHLLGRRYAITGRVVQGAQLGRTLGFPTANIALKRLRVALQGVYLVQVTLPDDSRCFGVANIGLRPTVDGKKASLEVHLLDVQADLYGQRLRVEFLQHIRDEQRFESLPALQAQIGRDVAAARAQIAAMA